VEQQGLLCTCGHPKNRHVGGTGGCSEQLPLLGERIPHPQPKIPDEKMYSTPFQSAMGSPETNCKCENFKARPRKGDTLENGWTVETFSEGLVWIVGRPLSPIPLENVAPTDRPGVWKLVKLESTDE
jgi:hypothetical protein